MNPYYDATAYKALPAPTQQTLRRLDEERLNGELLEALVVALHRKYPFLNNFSAHADGKR